MRRSRRTGFQPRQQRRRQHLQSPLRRRRFQILARDWSPPYVDNRPVLVAGKPELREYKAVLFVADNEASQFSDGITVNCAPLV